MKSRTRLIAIVAVLATVLGGGIGLAASFMLRPINIAGAIVDTITEALPEVVETEEVHRAPFDESAVRALSVNALTYQYSNFIWQERNKVVEWIGPSFTLPWGRSELGVEYQGKMQIGINGQEIGIDWDEDVCSSLENECDVIITLPKAEILSHEMVRGTTVVLVDRGRNSVADSIDLFESELEHMEERAIESGLLEAADASARDQLQAFINSLPGMNEYHVSVRTA